MTTWFVSRHAGAKEWIAARGFSVDQAVSHLDIEKVNPGDTVIGSLPVHLVAQVCARGATYWHLTLDLSEADRGKELTLEDMDRVGVRLERCHVTLQPTTTPQTKAKPNAESAPGLVLISCLGTGTPQDGRYRVATYKFDDGSTETTPFIGLALVRRLKPRRFVLLGTSSSIWDAWIEHLAEDGHALDETHRIELIDAVSKNAVEPQHLEPLQKTVSEALNCDCRLKLIPLGLDRLEQIEILRTLASEIDDRSTVAIDMTHGLRNLPMLGFASALYLRIVRQATIAGIYYGALELARNRIDGCAPVVSLDGLLDIVDWVVALHQFDKDADLSPIVPLLGRENIDIHALERACFAESVLQIGEARGKLKEFRQNLNQKLPGLAELFQSAIDKRTNWATQEDFSRRQAAVAQSCFEHRDYLRATIFALEAFISQQVRKRNLGDPLIYENRQRAKDEYEKAGMSEAYQDLRDLRNTLAHGTRAHRKRVLAALGDEAELKLIIADFLKTLSN